MRDIISSMYANVKDLEERENLIMQEKRNGSRSRVCKQKEKNGCTGKEADQTHQFIWFTHCNEGMRIQVWVQVYIVARFSSGKRSWLLSQSKKDSTFL